MRGAILAYHAQNCGGYGYEDNDHVALASDLRTVSEQGLAILPLRQIARHLAAGTPEALPARFVGFSCDDGTLLDWRDYRHPVFGPQRGFAGIVRDHFASIGADATAQLTAFVIASPAARAAIDAGCYEGIALSDENWWSEAAAEGLVAIENHSWDHVHTALPAELQSWGTPGDFGSVDNRHKAQQQVDAAAAYIDARLAGTGQRTRLFAYPYGHASGYLRERYLPHRAARLGLLGAFTTGARFVDSGCRPFAIPRFVHGDAWCTRAQFDALLTRLLAD